MREKTSIFWQSMRKGKARTVYRGGRRRASNVTPDLSCDCCTAAVGKEGKIIENVYVWHENNVHDGMTCTFGTFMFYILYMYVPPRWASRGEGCRL